MNLTTLPMIQSTKFSGAVVPLVTPATPRGELDLPALDRLVESQIAAGVEGVLVLGTTGEGPCVPRALRRPLVQRVAATARKRLRVYATVAESAFADAIASMESFSQAGADGFAVLAPFYYPSQPAELAAWFRALLDAAPGPVVMYNIPSTTGVSIPLDLIGTLIGHPRLVGIKDSENAPARHEELLNRFGRRSDFSIFIGVGSLMAQGLKAGADGVVPSVGNLIPKDCQQQVEAARTGNWGAVDTIAGRLVEVAAVYQRGRTLAQSLAALKGLLHHRGICSPHVFPPLLPLTAAELETLRGDLARLNLC